MATASLNIRLNYRQILELARQLSDEDKLDKQDMQQKNEIRIIIDTNLRISFLIGRKLSCLLDLFKNIPRKCPSIIYIFHFSPCHL